MRTRKKLVATFVPLTALAIVLSGCSSSGGGNSSEGGAGDNGDSLKIAAFVLATANAYSQSNIAGVEAAAEENGNVEVSIFDGEFSGATQLTQIQDALATGEYDGFVIFPNDGSAVMPGVREAAAEGLPVVASYAPIGAGGVDEADPNIEGLIGTVYHPSIQNGEAIAQLTLDACEQEHPDSVPCKVAYISGGNDILFEQFKLQGFKAALESSDIKTELVSQQEGDLLIDVARSATENILQANPNIDVIATSGDQMTVGASQAVKDSGATGISLIGNGASTEGVAAVAAGDWFGTAVLLPTDEAYLATEMLINAINGTMPAEPVVKVVESSDIGLVINKENATGFVGQWSTAG